MSGKAGYGGGQSMHAPRVGAGRRLLGPLHFTSVFWYRLHVFGVRFFPEWIKRILVPAFAGGFFLLLGDVRRSLGRNLEIPLGPAGWWTRQRRAWRVIREFAWSLTEQGERFVPRLRFTHEVEGLEHWEALNASPGGFILVTAHVGNWETASRLAGGGAERTIHLAREEELDPAAQAFIEKMLRAEPGARLQTHFLSNDPSQGLQLLEALRAGDLVALQCDRPRGAGGVVQASLFGVPFPMPEGPAALARAAEAPLLPVFNFREGRRRYRICIRPPVRVARTADRRADVAAATGELARHLEWAVGRAPYQWHCFADVRAIGLAGRGTADAAGRASAVDR